MGSSGSKIDAHKIKAKENNKINKNIKIDESFKINEKKKMKMIELKNV